MPLLRSQRPPSPKPLWVKRVIEFSLDTGEPIRVPAWCYGTLAVHTCADRDHPKPGWWVVTVTTVGKVTGMAKSEADARKIAERLWSLHSAAYRLRETKDMAAAIPGSTKDWIRACREAGKYVDSGTVPAV